MRFSRREFESRAGAIALRAVQKWLIKGDALRADRIGARIGGWAFRVAKSRRNRALSNLELAFPDMAPEERLRTTKGVFEHFGRVMCDFVRTGIRTPQELDASITAEGTEHFDEALAKGKGMILITGHFGNWERMAHWMTQHGYPLSVVVRDANNPDLNQLVLDLRTSAGLGVISRGSAARAILTKLKNNEMIGILPDENTGEAFLPFFGKPCGTVVGPAKISARSNAPLVPGFCYRVAPNRYHIVVYPPIRPAEDVPDPDEAMMVSVNRSLERIITEHPDQYLWIHDRWKAARQAGLL